MAGVGKPSGEDFVPLPDVKSEGAFGQSLTCLGRFDQVGAPNGQAGIGPGTHPAVQPSGEPFLADQQRLVENVI